MTSKTVSCKFDKEGVWRKVRDRKAIFLDTNCWINMRDDKSPAATRVKGTLRKLVSDGLVFCPLSFGLMCELYKQNEESRLRTETLMESLSLNVSYASQTEIFAWEVERGVRRIADAGPIDLSLQEIYVPISAYLSSRFHLEFPEGFPSEIVGDFTSQVREGVESLTLTQLLKMRIRNRDDDIFDFIKQIPPPKYMEQTERLRAITKGNSDKAHMIEYHTVYNEYIHPAMNKLPADVIEKLSGYIKGVLKNEYGAFLKELLKSVPSIANHVELMASLTLNPPQKDKINDFFDFDIMLFPSLMPTFLSLKTVVSGTCCGIARKS